MGVNLAGMADKESRVFVADIYAQLATLGGGEGAELESVLGQLAYHASTVDEADLVNALGSTESLRAALMHPAVKHTRVATQAGAYAQMERLRGIISAGTGLQVSDAQRPNVFIVMRFKHLAAGALSIPNLKPSLPAQSTMATDQGPLHFIQARTWLKSGAWENADIDLQVARVGIAQYQGDAAGGDPVGLPIEMWSPQSYNNGIKPPKIRGLEQADSNTIISGLSTATAPLTYAMTLEFVMQAFLGGNCARIMPSIIRGPMNITLRR